MGINNYIVSALKSVINKDGSFAFDNTIDYSELFKVSCEHQVENIVAYALMPYKERINADVWQKFEKSIMITAAQDTRQTFELGKLLEGFENTDIDYMILKGYIIKPLYPTTDLRVMGDVDILVKPAQATLAKTILTDLGYEITYENVREFNCVKNRFIHMEIHLDMISAQYKKYHDYYTDIWDKVTNVGGHSYKMTDEDYFIYHIVHLMKHYRGTGTGIRSFLDIWVFLKNKPQLDWDYIFSELKKLDLDIFAKNVTDLANMWFGGAKKTELLDEMAEYVFKSGVYGSCERGEIHSSIESVRHGKLHTYIHILFPGMHVMSSLYPQLINRRYLLWFFYIKRIFDKIFTKNETRKKSIAKLSAVNSSEEAKEISRHLKAVGLWEDM